MKTKRAGKAMVSLRDVMALKPVDADSLHRFVERSLGVRVVRKAVVPGNDAPFEYLCEAFLGRRAEAQAVGGDTGEVSAKPQAAGAHGDVVVWASRGSGKTMLGAIATLLELVFKPGIEVRILGASLQQSAKMYEHLRRFVQRPLFRGLLASEPTERQIALVNGSVARLLTQSPRSVRGEHVHRIRCDEVDDFKEHIWSAAQLATKSGRCGGEMVRGRIEALSTMHRAYGAMHRVMERAKEKGGQRVIRWSAIDVMERCPAARPCEGCKLWNHCLGRAKEAEGFIAVDDMIGLFERTSDDTWAAEMMCLRPRRDTMVYKRFDPTPGGRHVMDTSPGGGKRVLVGAINTSTTSFSGERIIRSTLKTAGLTEHLPEPLLVGGMDFGMRNPFVMLWARLVPPAEGEGRATNMEDWTIEVVDELHEEGLTMDQAVIRMEESDWPRPTWIGVDPAGGQRNRQTGISDIEFLRRRGYKLLAKKAKIDVGVEIIRRRLDRGTLRIDPICTRLIRAMTEYHFDHENPQNTRPIKDGPDHACDALRYLIVNLEFGAAGKTEFGKW